MSDKNDLPELIYHPSDALQIQWFCDDQIIVYAVHSLTPDLPQQWADLTVRVVENWSKERPYLAVHDLTRPSISLPFAIKVKFDLLNLGITPAGYEKIAPLLAANPAFRAYIAVVLNQSTSGYMGQIYAAYQDQGASPITYRLFYDYQTAFEWLDGMCQHG